jgi:hypothetical protein
MTIRLYNHNQDYDTICRWFAAWGWPAIPQESLPKIGAINDIAAAWLYQTDSDIALIEWFVTDKDAKDNREEAKQDIISFLTVAANRMGFKNVLTFIRNPNLIRSFEKNGFFITDNNVKIMTKGVSSCL